MLSDCSTTNLLVSSLFVIVLEIYISKLFEKYIKLVEFLGQQIGIFATLAKTFFILLLLKLCGILNLSLVVTLAKIYLLLFIHIK